MARRIHNARVNESVGLDLYSFNTLIRGCGQSSGKYEMNLPNMQKPGCGKGSAVDRSREQTIGAVKKKMKEQMDDFQVMRESIGQEYREVVERRVFTVTGNRLDEETIDGLIETGRSEQIFKDAVQQQGRAQVARETEPPDEQRKTEIDPAGNSSSFYVKIRTFCFIQFHVFIVYEGYHCTFPSGEELKYGGGAS
ncbi:unnamed protein product [Triticum turgidum subsp. durum]|uniref:Syntaxin N-terminal domain-containing protein n=1 Tax=Triticum turgidum subsp. durum TaxID=4567 RepID=A0A9R0TRD2_TRITD|nr:unnamed protein product [Triticum turgidum subsp. durum]